MSGWRFGRDIAVAFARIAVRGRGPLRSSLLSRHANRRSQRLRTVGRRIAFNASRQLDRRCHEPGRSTFSGVNAEGLVLALGEVEQGWEHDDNGGGPDGEDRQI